MKKSLSITIILLVFIVLTSTSQNIAILSDYLNRVLIFDDGDMRQIEHLPIRSFQTGNHAVAYEDNTGTFKIYHNNYTHTVSNFVTEYVVTNNLITFRLNRQLKVFDNGNIRNLGVSIPYWEANEDVVVWYDDLDKMLRAYYNGEIFDLDDGLASGALREFKTGKNTIVYTDSRNNINIFYKGEVYEVCFKDRSKSIMPGQDIVAFVEDPMENFQVFYRGEFLEIEPFKPISYKLADGFVAYVDNSNYLKVFSDYSVETVSLHNPVFYEVKDQLMVYAVQNYFRVFYNGRVHNLESFIPNKYIMNNNVVVYLDQSGNLKFFQDGKTEIISYESLSDFELQGNCVLYKFGVRSENIFCNGRSYKND